MSKLTEIKREHEESEEYRKSYGVIPEPLHSELLEQRAYLLSLLEEKDKSLHGQHRYFERISVTFGEFECQRLAKEAMEKYTSSNNEGE